MNTEGPIVGLRLDSRPQSLTIVRGMLSGVAELLAMDPELLDDLKTSVSEACNNVVLHAYGDGTGPMEVRVFVDDAQLRVTVADEGVGLSASPAHISAEHGVGVSVIQALARETRFTSGPGGGTEVELSFDARRGSETLFEPVADTSRPPADVPLGPLQEGEVAVTLSPVELLAGVLGRLARTLAATAHFSLDRFSDVYLVTDMLAAHAGHAAAGPRISARLMGGERRLELSVGPFRRGAGALLQTGDVERMSSPLALLADEISVRERGDDEFVDVVVIDHRR